MIIIFSYKISLNYRFFCGFILWFRFLDFKLGMEANKPFGIKPLITVKTAKEKGLNTDDLNFIYESTDSYELDDELIKRVEDYRKKNNLHINSNYKIEARKCKITNKVH